jgi:hypothetical protein
MRTTSLRFAAAVAEPIPYPDILCNECNYLRKLILCRESELRDLRCKYDDKLVEYLRTIARETAGK